MTYGHRLEPHIADTALLCHETLEPAARRVRGRAGHAARHRPRHLSVRHLVEPDRRRGLRRRRHRADGDRRGLGHREGLHHARRRRARSRPSSTTRSASTCARRARVRHHHRPPAPLRLARPGRAALRGAHERPDRPRDHEARRARRHRPAQRLHELPPREGAIFDEFPYHQSILHSAKAMYVELPGWEEDIGGCRTLDDLPARRPATTSTTSRSSWTCRVLMGVGPGREQVIWTEAAQRSRVAAGAVPS